MRRQKAIETGRDRLALAKDAGLGRVSLLSVLTGMLVAYGAFVLVAAIAAGILNALGIDPAVFTTNDWREVGVGGGIAVALVLFLSYLFGGYVAGRMARRAGAVNGLFVFLFGVVVAAAVGAAIGTQADTDSILDNLRSLGVPTSGSEWRAIGTVAGLGSLLAMLLGSILGGASGDRWHGKLVARALDPTVGPDAERPDTAGRREPEVDLRDRPSPAVATGESEAKAAPGASADDSRRVSS
jgi:hypothetical protein